MDSNSDEIEVVISKETYKIIDDIFNSFLQRYPFVINCSRGWNK